MAMLTESFLKEHFKVWSKFEKVSVYREEVWMRSEVRIVRSGSMSPLVSNQQKSDAVIVMHNPGSCMPNEETPSGTWTQSKADQTQLQLMRLMETMGWNELMMVNLVELCERNKLNYAAQLKRCENAGVAHSRFAQDPASEWSKVISGADHLLYGWGGKQEAREFANTYGLLDMDEMFKIHKKKPIAVWHQEKGYPKHPSPWRQPEQSKAWLEAVTGMLKVGSVV